MSDRAAVLFGRQLRAARERLGLSQREMGKRVHMTQAGISLYETGTRTPPLDVALKLAQGAGFSLDALNGPPPCGFTCNACGAPGGGRG